MKSFYKEKLIAVPHCGDCKKELLGNGSFITPYQCPCGEWDLKFTDDYSDFEYQLKK